MASVSGWSEAIILCLVFVAVLTLVAANYNTIYHKTNNVGFADNGTEQLFIDYQSTAQQQIKGGEVDFNAQQGITLKSSYGMAKDVLNIVWTFVSGGWIENTIGNIGLGEAGTALARGLRIIYFLSLVFALLYALFKVAF